MFIMIIIINKKIILVIKEIEVLFVIIMKQNIFYLKGLICKEIGVQNYVKSNQMKIKWYLWKMWK